MTRFRLFAATILLVVAPDAFAQKTDVVILKNGDRLTCEVKELSRGQLKLSTDDIGTIYVEWDKVTSVSTTGLYELATTSGALFVGTLAPDTLGMLQVIAADGAISRIGSSNVVSIWAIKSGFLGRIDGSMDVGGSYTQSSGVGQLSVGFAMSYRRPGYEVFSNFDGNLTTQEEAETTARLNWSSGYTRLRPNRWTVSPFVFVERNPDLGLTVRGAGALSVGRFLHQSARASFLLTGGLSAGVEQPIEGEAVNNLEALAAVTTSYYHYDYPRRNIDLSVLLFPSLSDWGRVRANAQVRAKQEVFNDFFLGASVYNIFDSRPVVEDANLNDFGVSITIGWTF